MCGILGYLIEGHKKTVVSSIAVLYPAMLVAQKLSNVKFIQLLFPDQATQAEKSVLLLLKPEVTKQFNVQVNIQLDNEDATKLSTPVYQRNCHALLKAWKDIVGNYWSLPEDSRNKIQEPWSALYEKFIVLLRSDGVGRYLKDESRAKAALLEVFVQVLQVHVERKQPAELNTQYFVSTLVNNFTSKDMTIQTTMWKYCNTPLLGLLPQLKQEQLMRNLDQRLLESLRSGGVAMLKELPNWVQHLPSLSMNSTDINLLIGTINYFRKLSELILDLDDEHEARLECYCSINLYLIKQYRRLRSELLPNTADDKENKRREELKKITEKAER
jgi:hypothetical protein